MSKTKGQRQAIQRRAKYQRDKLIADLEAAHTEAEIDAVIKYRGREAFTKLLRYHYHLMPTHIRDMIEKIKGENMYATASAN